MGANDGAIIASESARQCLSGPQIQSFNFGWLERSTRKHNIRRCNLGKLAHSGFSHSERIDSDRKPILGLTTFHSYQTAARSYLIDNLAITDQTPECFRRSTRKDYIVILVRNDHEIRSCELTTLSQFVGYNSGHSFGAINIWQCVSDIVGMQY